MAQPESESEEHSSDDEEEDVKLPAANVENDMMCDPSSMKTYVTDNLIRSRDVCLGLCRSDGRCLSEYCRLVLPV